jgi:NAD+ diphosphatase
MAVSADDVLVVLRGTEVLVERVAHGTALCSSERAAAFAASPIFVTRRDERSWYAARAQSSIADLPDGLAFSPVRALFSELPEATLHLVGSALACVEFEETHRFCGRCGAPTEPGTLAAPSHDPIAERVRACPRCQLVVYPRIPPAVIVLVEREGRILLARGPNFPPGRFGAVAGFVGIGESLEEAARREVREEVGIEIEDLRYFSSQPWPFGHSLMIGFYARYAGGELVPDGTEIVEAAWFELDALPQLPPPISIARKLIDAFLVSRPPADRG